jgi:hypothetical protein
MPLHTAAEIASATPYFEASDEELAAGYSPGFPSSPDPHAEIATVWGILPYRQAVAKERAEYIARRRKAIQDGRVRSEAAASAATAAKVERERFERQLRKAKPELR